MVLSKNPFKRLCQKWAKEESWFDYFITSCIILNTIVMSINWFECPPHLLDYMEDVNYVFTAIFTIEVGIKITAFNAKGYFNRGWNIFDFTIVVISYLTLIIGLVKLQGLGPR